MAEGFNATQREIEILAVRKENAKLRAALEIIAETANYLGSGHGVVGDLEKIARAALDGSPK